MEERPAGPDCVSIETPEHVLFTYEVAGLMTRGLAVLIDHLLQLLLLIIIAVIAGFGGVALQEVGREGRVAMTATLMLGTFVVVWGYFVFFVALVVPLLRRAAFLGGAMLARAASSRSAASQSSSSCPGAKPRSRALK